MLVKSSRILLLRTAKTVSPHGRTITNWFQNGLKGTKLENAPESLYDIYVKTLLPLEDRYLFHDFHAPKFTAADFDAKSTILLMGQYSTGKTTFIRFLLNQDFSGMAIGPEPTTDKFVVVMKGHRDCVIPGNALVLDTSLPYTNLSTFGNAFLKRFQCSKVNSPVLDHLNIIDTPGILSGEKERIDRGYDFAGVLNWFASRVDRIILLFDAHKLDISDEFKCSLLAVKGHEEKIRILLNKSDKLTQQQLMRVYGALMWSLGKVFTTPEVSRVFVGSFWDKPIENVENRRFFEDEREDLFKDLRTLPIDTGIRKLNDFSKRARLAKIHAYIISDLADRMPRFFRGSFDTKPLIDKLPEIFQTLQTNLRLPPSDFPDVKVMQEQLRTYDFTLFKPLKKKMIKDVDDMLSKDIGEMLTLAAKEEVSDCKEPVSGGALKALSTRSPFGAGRDEGINYGYGDLEWVVNQDRTLYDEIYSSLDQVQGIATRAAVKSHFLESRLPDGVLDQIWIMSDLDKDNLLDKDEFALAKHLIKVKCNGHDLPSSLPKHLIPPNKRISV